jgi:hypothetical protein
MTVSDIGFLNPPRNIYHRPSTYKNKYKKEEIENEI